MKNMRKKILPGIVISLMSLVLIFSVFALPASAATSIKNAVISIENSTYTYTGKTIKPTVTVKVGKKKLSSKSYTVSYKNNKSVGKATITVKGKGSYTGTATKSFYIRPKKVSSLKATPYSTKVKLSWGKVTGAKGYQVYQYIDGKWKKLDNTTKTSYIVSPLESATTYKFRVRAYAKTGSKYLYSSSFTSLSATTTIGKPATFKISDLKETSATLSWNEVDKADEYRVSLTDEVTEKTKSYTVTSTSIAFSDLASYRDYTVRVRGYNEEKDILGNNSDYFTFKTAPAAVKSFKAEAGASSINLSWNPTDNITTYQVYMCTYDDQGAQSSFTKLANVNGSSYIVNGLAPCTDYGFRVRAYVKTSAGYVYSEYADSNKVTVPLGKVSALTCTAKTDSTLTLTWGTVPGAAGYKLYMNGNQVSLSSPGATTYTATGLTPDTAYNFYVIAHCAKAGCDKCDENSTVLTNVKTDDSKVDSIEFVTKPTAIAPGKTDTVKARVLPEYAANKNITYKSSNTAVATVDSKTGEITAVKSGTTTITATSEDGGKTVSYTLTVKNVVSTGISVPSTVSLTVGETFIINPTFTPAETSNKAFTVTGADHTYTYKSGLIFQQTKTDTCKLSDYISIGQNGLIRALKATIEPQTNKAFSFVLTVRAADSGKTATVRVSIIKKMLSVTYLGDDSPWYYGNSAKLSATLDSSISSKYPASSLKWKSSDTSIAAVSSDGTVTVKGKGLVTITAYTSDNAYSGSFQIYCRSVVEIEKDYFENCKVGGTYQIKASLRPGGDGETVNYASTDDSVASVDSKGLVTFKKPGGVNIIVMTSADTVNTKEVWFTSGTYTRPTGTKQQLFNILKEKADSVKTSDNLPGFTRNDSSTFTNFDLVNTSSYGEVLKEEDLYGMFSDLAAPKSFVQAPVSSGSTSAWENYMLNVPVRGQYMTIMEGLEMSDIKSVVVLDYGSYTYDIKLILEEESFTYLPTSGINTRHGKVFDILTNSYLSSALNTINNSGEGMKITYDSFAQRYHDSSLTVSVNKVTGKVSDMKYDMNIDIDIRNLKIEYSFFTYTADIGFDCNNVVTLDFFGYKD